MGLAITRQNVATIVRLDGRLDLVSGDNLKAQAKELLANGSHSIHLSLRGVDFINSSGLGAMISVLKEVRLSRGRLTLSDLSDFVREMFDLTLLSQIFEIYASEEEALASYSMGSIE